MKKQDSSPIDKILKKEKPLEEEEEEFEIPVTSHKVEKTPQKTLASTSAISTQQDSLILFSTTL